MYNKIKEDTKLLNEPKEYKELNEIRSAWDMKRRIEQKYRNTEKLN